MLKRIFRIILALLLVVLAVVLIYVAYVFISYHRLDDNLSLTVEGGGQGTVSASDTLRIASYNVGFGAYSSDYSFFMDGGTESRARSADAASGNVSGAGGEALALSPDIMLFQEVDVGSTRSWQVDEYDILTGIFGGSYSRVFAENYDSPYLFYPITQPHGASRSGIVTFSAYPITSALRRSLPIEAGVMKLVDLDRCYSVSRIPVSNGRELVVYNVHLSAYTSDGKIAETQLEMLFDDMLAEYSAGNYAIAGGDFNKDLLGDSGSIFGVSGENYTWAQPIPENIVPEGLSIVAPYDPDNPIPSCRNADKPYGEDSFVLTVDGFVISGNVELIYSNVHSTGFRWSDHDPVYMDIRLK